MLYKELVHKLTQNLMEFGAARPLDEVDRTVRLPISDICSVISDAGYASDFEKHSSCSDGGQTPRNMSITEENIGIILRMAPSRNLSSQIKTERGESFVTVCRENLCDNSCFITDTSMLDEDDPFFSLVGVEPLPRRDSISRHSQTSPVSSDDDEHVPTISRRKTPIWLRPFRIPDRGSREDRPQSPIAHSFAEPPPDDWSPTEQRKALYWQKKRKLSLRLNSIKKLTDKQIVLITSVAGLFRDKFSDHNVFSVLQGLNESCSTTQPVFSYLPSNGFSSSRCEMCEENVEVPEYLQWQSPENDLAIFSPNLCKHKVMLLREIGSVMGDIYEERYGENSWDDMAVAMGVGDKSEQFHIARDTYHHRRELVFDIIKRQPPDLDESIEYLRKEIRNLTITNEDEHKIQVLRKRLFNCLLMRTSRQRRLRIALSGVWSIAYGAIYSFTLLSLSR